MVQLPLSIVLYRKFFSLCNMRIFVIPVDLSDNL